MMKIVFAFVALLAIASAVDVKFSDCGSKLISIKSITASAWPPMSGQPLVLTLQGTASQSLSSGSFTSTTLYNGIQVDQQTGDFCSIVPCPVNQGAVSFTSNSTVPDGLPSGEYTSELNTSTGSNTIFCVKMSWNM